MTTLFINLLFALIFRLPFRFANLGNIITHVGFIVLLAGSFLTFYFSQESVLTIREGESSSMSSSRLSWELAVWEQGGPGGERDVYALDLNNGGPDPGDNLQFSDLGLTLKTREYYQNCSAFTANDPGANIVNGSGIGLLKAKPAETEAGQNVAGGVFEIQSPPDTTAAVLLYGGESSPTTVRAGEKTFVLILRRKKIALPLTLFLKDFKVKMYPNSAIPKSYESLVKIKGDEDGDGGVEREVLISMNRPLRYKDLTFFQSSYFIAQDGTQYSTLAVVKNSGRLLPYISSILIFLGMAIHFLMMMIKGKKTVMLTLFICLLALSAGPRLSAEVKDLEVFRRMAVMENGRVKPLDTFAQNMLKQFSGRDRFGKEPAIRWLARVLFNPAASYEDKVFLVTNPEALDSMGVTRQGKARDRYAFSQLQKGLPKLRKLAFDVSKKNPGDRSFIENEIIGLYNKLYVYQQLVGTFDFLSPHDDFTVTEAETREMLQLPDGQERFSYLDLLRRWETLTSQMVAIREKPAEERTATQKEVIRLAMMVEQWRKYYSDLPFTVFPPLPVGHDGSQAHNDGSNGKWLSPWEMLVPGARALPRQSGTCKPSLPLTVKVTAPPLTPP